MAVISLEPINIDSEGIHLLLNVYIFDQLVKLVLDTGASRTVFDLETIQSLQNQGDLKSVENLSAGLGTTTMQSFTYQLPELRIGDEFIIKEYTTAVLDLSSIKSTYAQLNMPPVVGVLGGDVLVNYNAIINYRNLTLNLQP